MKELRIAIASSLLGWIGLNLIVLGGIYGFILYQYNFNGKKYEFDLLKSRMTVDEFMMNVEPDEFIRMVKAKGIQAKIVGGSCKLIGTD